MNKKQILTTTLAAIFIAATTIFTGCQKEKAKVTGVTLCPTALMVSMGNNGWLTGEIIYSPNSLEPDWGLTWVSAHPNIAIVEQSGSEALGTGLVTPKAVGETTVTCRTNDGGFTASSTVIVNPKEIDSDYATLVPRFYIGDTKIDGATAHAGRLITVKYYSKNKIIYSIDDTFAFPRIGGGIIELSIKANLDADITKEGECYMAVREANMNIEGAPKPAILRLEGTFTPGVLDLIINIKDVPNMEDVILNFKGIGKYQVDCPKYRL